MKSEEKVKERLKEIKSSLKICRIMRNNNIADNNIRIEIDNLLCEMKILKWILKED